MKINTIQLWIKTSEDIASNGNKLRGYIGNEFKEYNLLHNHFDDTKYLFSYPLIQYKIIDGKALILGIDEGVDLIKKIYPDIDNMKLEKDYEIEEKIMREKLYDIKPTTEERSYKFISPWLGLNKNNYENFKALESWKEKKQLLNKIIVGNILSMSKGLGIVVNKRLYAKSHLDFKMVKYKSIHMTGFEGEFKVHYDIPDYFGIGKGSSHGFGCVKRIIK
ncbi:CRISPR-associated endonuclease Cas6 [uncultured Methanobrevibacter sp.]|uniref:CRISPR-associated endonuclease Cas6 n=1 Tax=uncultured Methanobrevibacter sp. TaxID=253161 RepID=UPI0026E10330|nr:CRISPR-associated endonuclease Cas6 [uncultured Methanobrevibacter sp.]